MRFTSHLFAFVAPLALLAVSAVGQATPIEATYSVDLHTAGDGLKVDYADVAPNPFSFNLNVGETKSGKLFKIWTDEKTVHNDDTTPQDIAVDFEFTLPATFGGKVAGTTVGGRICLPIFGCPAQWGEVDWDNDKESNALDIFFGPKEDGHLQIWLEDAVFNPGAYGTIPGEFLGATIWGHMKLVADATSVPEPSILALFGFGLIGLGFAARRRRG